MKINREKLLEALSSVGRVVGRRITLPILSCVKISGHAGRFQIRGTDLERDLLAEIDCDGDLPVTCAPLRLVAEFSESADAETIDIGRKENRRMEWRCGRDTTEIPSIDPTTFPIVSEDKATAIGVNPKDIADGISSVAWACVSDPNEITLSCVRVYARGNKVFCEACDRKTLAHFSRNSIAAEFDILIPAQSALSAVEFLNKDGAVLAIGENSFAVKYDGGIFSARLAKAQPTATHLLLELERQPLGDVVCADLVSALSVCKIPEGSGLFQMEFQFSSTGLVLECEESNFKFRRTIPGKFTPNITRLDVERATAAVKAMKSETLSMFSFERGLGFQFGDTTVFILRVRKMSN